MQLQAAPIPNDMLCAQPKAFLPAVHIGTSFLPRPMALPILELLQVGAKSNLRGTTLCAEAGIFDIKRWMSTAWLTEAARIDNQGDGR